MTQFLKPDKVGELGYKNYQLVREHVISSIQARNDELEKDAVPSLYWQEELSGFDYMLEASPLLINKLRYHSFHLTGLKHYEYRSSQSKLREAFRRKLQELKKVDKSKLFVPDIKALGGFGHEIDGHIVNVDTLKFYESLIALDKAGMISTLRQTPAPVIVEIGSGWGGFAYQMKKNIPQATYVLVDFPECFLFSATFLMTLFPESRVEFIRSAKEKDKLGKLHEFDFVFIAQEVFHKVWENPCDLAVNMVSFQEMTTEQVDGYAKKFWQTGAKHIYSHNRDRSKHNSQLSLVSAILANYFELQKITVLDGPYTNINAKAPIAKKPEFSPRALDLDFFLKRGQRKQTIQHYLNKWTSSDSQPVKKAKKNPWMEYQHFLGTPTKRPSN